MQELTDVDRVLARDPSGMYGQLDVHARTRYNAVIDEWAVRSGRRPSAIAELVVRQAEAADVAAAPRAAKHVGYYLVDAGVPAIEKALQLEWTATERRQRFLRANVARVYAVVSLGSTLVLAGAASAYAVASGASWLVALAVLAVASLSRLFGVGELIGRSVCGRWTVPRVLPKMAFASGIPPTHRTLVVVSSLLRNTQQTEMLVARLGALAAANEDANLDFALLTDFGDAPNAQMPEDASLLAAVARGVEQLDLQRVARRGSGAGRRRLFVLHRERRWNEADGVWMGWRRKQGKVEELTRLLREPGTPTSFHVDADRLRASNAGGAYRYLLCLDEDTWMPPGQARTLVRTAAHPLNCAEVDSQTGRLTRGFGIFDPAILPTAPETPTRFVTLRPPLPSRPYFPPPIRQFDADVFGEGHYSGKGLVDIDVYRSQLAGRLPEPSVLSHDLVEGLIARRAFVGDAYLFEPVEARFSAGFQQQSRWLRGFVQHAPWLLPRVRGADGVRRRNPLSITGRWLVAATVIRTSGPAWGVALACIGWLVGGAPSVWLLLALLPICQSLLLIAFRRSAARLRAWRTATPAPTLPPGVIAMTAKLTLVDVILEAQKASNIVSAISRATWRMCVSKRRLVEWRTQQDVGADVVSALTTYARTFAGSMLAVLVVLVAVARIRPSSLPVVAPIVLVWLSAFVVCWYLDQPAPAPHPVERAGVAPARLS